MSDLCEEKKRLRAAIRRKMRELPKEERRIIDRLICDRAAALPAFQRAETIFCFVGCDWEIDTSALINEAFHLHKKVAVPLCKGEGVMEVHLICRLQELHPGAYGIPEPDRNAPLCEPAAIDLTFLPCTACDERGGRLGQGGGFYDRFLKNAGFYTAALCREGMLLKKVPEEPWDIRADLVVTERRVIACAGVKISEV